MSSAPCPRNWASPQGQRPDLGARSSLRGARRMGCAAIWPSTDAMAGACFGLERDVHGAIAAAPGARRAALRCRAVSAADLGIRTRSTPAPPATGSGSGRLAPAAASTVSCLPPARHTRERPSGPAARAAQPAATSPRSGPCRAGQCRRVDRQRQQHLEDRGAVIRRPVLLADDHDLQVGVGLRQINMTFRTHLLRGSLVA